MVLYNENDILGRTRKSLKCVSDIGTSLGQYRWLRNIREMRHNIRTAKMMMNGICTCQKSSDQLKFDEKTMKMKNYG